MNQPSSNHGSNAERDFAESGPGGIVPSIPDCSESSVGESDDRRLESRDFVSLIVRHEHRLRAFLLTLLPIQSDIDDLVQEVSLLAWEKHDQFRYTASSPDEQFVSWICTIAKFKVLNYRRRLARTKAIAFDERLIESLASIQIQYSAHLEDRRLALTQCIEKLSEKDRHLIRMRYAANQSIGDLAAYMQRTTDAAYKSLHRIRQRLLSCVEATLRREGSRQ